MEKRYKGNEAKLLEESELKLDRLKEYFNKQKELLKSEYDKVLVDIRKEVRGILENYKSQFNRVQDNIEEEIKKLKKN